MIGADDTLEPALRPEQWAGQPGTRAPHMWVTVNDEKLSTLDLFQRDCVLVANDERWCLAAAQVSEALGIGLKCLRIGVDFHPSNPEAFLVAFGLGTSGASLIRPDGYVAWRSIDLPIDSLQTLTEALGQVLSAASLSGVLTTKFVE